MAMIEQANCPHNRPNCDFAEEHELALVRRLVHVIENYTKEHRTYPCARCLRNSIMAIAALLHLEAAKIDEKRSGQKRSGSASFAEAFAEAARERMLSIMDAVVDLDSALARRPLM